MRALDKIELSACHCVLKCDSVLYGACGESPMLWKGHARVIVDIRNWTFGDFRPSGCADLLDFPVGYGKEAVGAPMEAPIVIQSE